MAGTKTRSIAILFTVFLIVFSLIYGPVRSLTRLANKADKEYFSKNENSVISSIERKNGEAKNLLSMVRSNEANNNYHVDQLNAIISELDEALEKKNLSSITQQSDHLTIAVNELYNEMASNSDFEYVNLTTAKGLLANIGALDNVIYFNAYNDHAKKYNDAISKFPASFYASLFNLNELPV